MKKKKKIEDIKDIKYELEIGMNYSDCIRVVIALELKLSNESEEDILKEIKNKNKIKNQKKKLREILNAIGPEIVAFLDKKEFDYGNHKEFPMDFMIIAKNLMIMDKKSGGNLPRRLKNQKANIISDELNEAQKELEQEGCQKFFKEFINRIKYTMNIGNDCQESLDKFHITITNKEITEFQLSIYNDCKRIENSIFYIEDDKECSEEQKNAFKALIRSEIYDSDMYETDPGYYDTGCDTYSAPGENMIYFFLSSGLFEDVDVDDDEEQERIIKDNWSLYQQKLEECDFAIVSDEEVEDRFQKELEDGLTLEKIRRRLFENIYPKRYLYKYVKPSIEEIFGSETCTRIEEMMRLRRQENQIEPYLTILKEYEKRYLEMKEQFDRFIDSSNKLYATYEGNISKFKYDVVMNTSFSNLLQEEF